MKNLKAQLTVLFLFLMVGNFAFAQGQCSPKEGRSSEGFISAKLDDVFRMSKNDCAPACCDYEIGIHNLEVDGPFCPGDDITVSANPCFGGYCFPNESCLFVSVILQNGTNSTVIFNGPYELGISNSITASTPDCLECDGNETVTYQIYDACCGAIFSETVAVECSCCDDDLFDCSSLNVTNTSSTGMNFTFDPVTDLGCCEEPYYNLGWRVAGSNDPWNYCCSYFNDNGTGGFFSLDPCTDYEYIVELKCDGVWTGETIESCTDEFTTAGNCCEDLLDCNSINITNIASDGMRFEFDPVDDLNCCEKPYYNLGWRLAGTSDAWNYCCTYFSYNGTGGFFSLDPCTRYEFIVELKCDGVWTGQTIESCTGEFQTAGWNCPVQVPQDDRNKRAKLDIDRPTLSPNPFSEEVQISYTVESSQNVQVSISDLSGRLIKILVNEVQPAGQYNTTWTAADSAGKQLSSGTYLVTIQQGEFILTEKLVLTK